MTVRASTLVCSALATMCLGMLSPHAYADGGGPGVTVAAPVDYEAAGTWTWPIVASRAVLRHFEAPATAYSAGHRGVDLLAPVGSQVIAPADGVVSFAGRVVDRPLLSITSAGGLVSSIEPVEASVSEGDLVTAGDVVGIVAVGGHCSDICAHFGVRLYGEYVNPIALLETVPRAILLPVRG
ncbi:M23 family metallopeptidase [Mycetocola zhadangensis]|nr:M23 family metallopeptidase [Mycetocola zhadangensis]GGE86592.1 hypothetical protein GCM10011313_06270 [Mycetocola zhadangensis]